MASVGTDDQSSAIGAVDRPPIAAAITAGEAINALYRRVGAIAVRVAETEVALTADSSCSAAFAIANLNVSWSVLDAWCDITEAVSADYAERELWALPAVQLAWEASQRVLAQGITHVVRHGAPALLVHLRRLSGRLAAQRDIAAIATDPEIQ